MRLEPNQAPYEGGWVFSSTGDITRKTFSPPENVNFARLGITGRKLMNAAAAGAMVAAQGVFSTLFPSDCRLCSTPLTNISRLPVCPSCLLRMTPISGATCDICGEGLGATHLEFSAPLCLPCQEVRPFFTSATAYGAYDSELRELIHLFKYEQVVPAANVLGRMLAEAIGKLNVAIGSFVVVPVPLHRGKRRQRGFNQAELIARAALKAGAVSDAELAADALERIRPTVSQIGLTRPQRAENIRGAFRVQHLNRMSGRNVLLVDDVFTTGTTANECARILRKAGAENVFVATVARTLKENNVSVGSSVDLAGGFPE